MLQSYAQQLLPRNFKDNCKPFDQEKVKLCRQLPLQTSPIIKAFLFNLSVARYYTTCQYYDHNLHAVTYLLVLEAWSLFPGVGSFWMQFVLFFFSCSRFVSRNLAQCRPLYNVMIKLKNRKYLIIFHTLSVVINSRIM